MIAVTARQLVKGDFFEKIKEVASMRPELIILREKDLNLDDYVSLFLKCAPICKQFNVPLAVNGFIEAIKPTGAKVIQLSYEKFINEGHKIKNIKIGVSVHSAEEAVNAAALGADYLIAGHIYDTDCKKGTPGRGIDFLKSVVNAVQIPVYAIGGVETPERQAAVTAAGAAGYCLMSSLMTNKK